MASDEILVAARLTDSALDVRHEDADYNVDRTGEGKIQYDQTIGAANELLQVNTDIGTVGWGYFKNMDSAKTISLATQDDTVYFALLLAGEKFPIPLGTDVIYAKASTASAVLRVTMLER